jgi:hypothetical protein
MITARKSAWFDTLFAAYNRHLIARRFEGLRVRGMEALTGRGRDAPLVLYANHSSWWDGLIVFQVGRAAGLAQYAMMEERQLRQYKVFRRLGAFSVVREDARSALESVRYAADLLRGTDGALWIFPQGRTEPNGLRPLAFYSGAARIAQKVGDVYLAPVALRYEFLDGYRPEAFVRIGALERLGGGRSAPPKILSRSLAGKLTATLDALTRDVAENNLAGYAELVAPRRRQKSSRG